MLKLLIAISFLVLAGRAVAAPVDFKGKLLEEINRVRLAGAVCGGKRMPSVSPLSVDDKLQNAAQGHADDMKARKYVAHESPDKTGPFDRMLNAGYTYKIAGENLTAGVAEPIKVVATWLRSTASCRTLMNAKFPDAGLGLTVDKTSHFRVFWVVDFGKKDY